MRTVLTFGTEVAVTLPATPFLAMLTILERYIVIRSEEKFESVLLKDNGKEKETLYGAQKGSGASGPASSLAHIHLTIPDVIVTGYLCTAT